MAVFNIYCIVGLLVIHTLLVRTSMSEKVFCLCFEMFLLYIDY